MNNTYFLEPYSGVYTFGLRKFKGLTTLYLNLTGLATHSKFPIQVSLDWGDASPVVEINTNFNDLSSVFSTVYSHEYLKGQSIPRIPSVKINYSNFTYAEYRMPIELWSGSFYSEYKNLEIASCQFIDVSSNDMFLSFDSANGDVLNLKIK